MRHLLGVAAAGLVLAFVVQGLVLALANAPTYDEAMHVAAGASYLTRGDFRIEPENPPLAKAWLAAPVVLGYRLPFHPRQEDWEAASGFVIGQALVFGSTVPAGRIVAAARLANLLLGTLLVLLVGWWARRLWGRAAGLLALALACLEPTLVAHSTQVTTDAAAALFLTLALYLLWEHGRAPSTGLALAAGVAVGLALASKYSTLALLPMIGLILAGEVVGRDTGGAPGSPAWPARLGASARTLALVLLAAAAVIPLAYALQGFGPWWRGLRLFLELGATGQPAFFLGRYSDTGWWGYFPVAFLLKTPLGTLLLVAASLALPRAGARLGRREALALVAPAAILFGTLAQASINIGIRHALAVYPLLLVLAGRLATVRLGHPGVVPAGLTLAVALTALSVLRVAPHQLAYFNELAGGPAGGHRYLSDSNLDWGQDLGRLAAYLRERGNPVVYLSYFGTAPPAAYGIRSQYVPGSWPIDWPPPPDRVPADARPALLAVSVFHLQEVLTHRTPLFAWLRNREPVARIGYSIHVYDLTGDRQARLALGAAYATVGLDEMAAEERAKAAAIPP